MALDTLNSSNVEQLHALKGLICFVLSSKCTIKRLASPGYFGSAFPDFKVTSMRRDTDCMIIVCAVHTNFSQEKP